MLNFYQIIILGWITNIILLFTTAIYMMFKIYQLSDQNRVFLFLEMQKIKNIKTPKMCITQHSFVILLPFAYLLKMPMTIYKVNSLGTYRYFLDRIEELKNQKINCLKK